jgi:hypothetical protein
MIPAIHCFEDFCSALAMAGFAQGSDSTDSVFSLAGCFGAEIQWHTGNRDTDPWEWRMRVLRERNDIAYAKLFSGRSGYITKEWYPYFLAVRRGNDTAEDAYADGRLSRSAMKIFSLVEAHAEPSLTELKHLGQFERKDKTVFDKALAELQARLFVTICGMRKKATLLGSEYGWNVTAFCTPEAFFDEGVFTAARQLSADVAYAAIEAQILELSPACARGKIKQFITG